MGRITALIEAHPVPIAVGVAGLLLFFLGWAVRRTLRRRRDRRIDDLRGIVQRIRRASVSSDPVERRRIGGAVSLLRKRCEEWGLTLADAHTNEREIRKRMDMIEPARTLRSVAIELPLRYPHEQPEPRRLVTEPLAVDPCAAPSVPLQEVTFLETELQAYRAEAGDAPSEDLSGLIIVPADGVPDEEDDEIILFIDADEVVDEEIEGLDTAFAEYEEPIPPTLPSVERPRTDSWLPPATAEERDEDEESFSRRIDGWFDDIQVARG